MWFLPLAPSAGVPSGSVVLIRPFTGSTVNWPTLRSIWTAGISACSVAGLLTRSMRCRSGCGSFGVSDRGLACRSASIGVERPERAGGQAQYNLFKLIKLAVTGLTSFSTKPLRLAIGAGFLLCLAAIGLALYYLIQALVYDLHSVAPGFATLVILLLLLNGITMLLLGIIGEYLAQIFLEVKGRPTFVVERYVNFRE